MPVTSTSIANETQLNQTDYQLPVNSSLDLQDLSLTQANQYNIIRRNGKLTLFDGEKISLALTKAFLAVEGGRAAASRRIHEIVRGLTAEVTHALFRRLPDGGTLHIEDIQDQVELALMRNGHHKIARAYVLYRDEHKRQRDAESRHSEADQDDVIMIKYADVSKPLNKIRVKESIREACENLTDVDVKKLFSVAERNFFDGMTEKELATALVMSARTYIEHEPNYSFVAARLLLNDMRLEANRAVSNVSTNDDVDYQQYFPEYLNYAIDKELLDPELAQFDLAIISVAIKPEQDYLFTYLGLQTLYDRYFIQHKNTRIELPQAFFMRVAMGLAINEIEREIRAIEFYNLLSSFAFMSSTPTLFNSGTLRPQLSSCYLTTVPDDLAGIFSSLKDNALLSKFAGGLGNDWTNVRGMGAHIKGTNGESQGVVPFLKVANDIAVAVNQGGKRKGAMCAYLETWHIDIEDFLDLRKNTGDERRRTHDMNTANWIPDLFMQRVAEEAQWTLFSPEETPELHDLYGVEFNKKYQEYEARAEAGELTHWRRIPAIELWRKLLGQLFETGHPWITFKDPCNLRYTNQHRGIVHSSNLCTEITLHTSDKEIAVCNLGSINLAAHVDETGIQTDELQKNINIAMRMLDNVIEYNYYAVPQARHSNLQHRPVGLGMMGFQDALYKLNIPYASQAAIDFADLSSECLSYFALSASADLAVERGSYPTFSGSLWSQGILPIDSIQLLKESRPDYLNVDQSQTLDWSTLRQRIKNNGIRNSNCLAIAPTATISNICGVSQSVEPTYQNLYVKSNLSGEFMVINPYLVDDLKIAGLWDDVMVNDLKYFDGSIQKMSRVPDNLKEKYATAFEIDSRWLIEAAARRQKWLDQSQSLNLYLAEPNGAMLDKLYKLAWVRGLKTTYYLRTLGATHNEKNQQTEVADEEPVKVCSILDSDCEACQ